MKNNEINRIANFIGIAIHPLTYENMLEKVDYWLSNKNSRSHHIACINTYCVTLALKDKRLAKIYNGADIAGPDSMPFVYWIRAFLKIPCDRFAGADITLELAKQAEHKGYTFYLYGGDVDVVQKMKEYLVNKFPYINIVGYHSPPFRPLTKEEDQSIIDEINRLSPDIILVGLGTPKQDYWIDDHAEDIKGAVCISIGAVFDFFGGRVKIAPEFIRRSGFEWLYRLLSKDFKRLWRRYTIYNVIFLWNFLLQILRIRINEPQTWKRPG